MRAYSRLNSSVSLYFSSSANAYSMNTSIERRRQSGLLCTMCDRGRQSAGFTLVELLVTLSIMIIITMITVLGKTQFERSIFLTNLTYDIALAVREAQVYGTNVRPSSTGAFKIGYGVRFSTLTPTSFVLYEDANDNHRYDSGNNELVREYSIKNNNKIVALCAVASDSSNPCNPISGGILDVTFRRPDPNACFNTTSTAYSPNTNTSTCVLGTQNAEARITVQASGGATRCIRIFTTGQISITPTCT